MKGSSKILIVSVILCLGGLVWVQTHLLRNAFLQSEKTFDRNVQITLHNVADELLSQNKKRKIEHTIDSTIKYSQNQININVRRDISTSETENVAFFEQKIIIRSDDTDYVGKLNIDSFYSLKWTHQFIKELIEDQEDKWANKQLDSFDFRSSILQNLNKLNLPDSFEYAIVNGSDSLLFGSFNFRNQGKVYSKPLFTNNIYSKSGSLLLKLPERKFSILSEILIPLVLSVVFLLIASALFYYLYGLYKRQKLVSEVRDDFINSMSHELKTPLATIALSVENLKSEDNMISPYLNIIKEENTRMLHYIENILQLAQMDNTTFTLSKETCNINEIIQDIVKKEGIRVKNKKGNISFTSQSNITASIDPIHFRNMIHNLIDNSLKYNNNPPVIQINVTETTGSITISISDNGRGISSKSLGKIFDKFYRTQRGNIYTTKGTGIGLSYCKRIIDLHKGSIKVESTLEIGTTFIISLPK